jgi:branched-chain amino acid transport system substrate-binding protein
MPTFRNIASLAAALLPIAALPAAAADYQVLVIQSVTGPAAFVGAPVVQGARLAQEHINQRAVLGAGNTLKLIIEDDGGSRDQAITLINRHGRGDASTLMVYGPTTSATAIPTAQAANEIRIPLLASTNATDVIRAGKYAFKMTQSSKDTVPVVVNYAAAKLGVKKCGIASINDNPAYADLTAAFRSAAEALKITVVDHLQFKTADSDFSAVSVRAAALDMDCLFLAAPPTVSGNVLVQFRQAGLKPDIKIIAPNSAASPDFPRIAGKAAEGTYVSSEFLPGGADDAGRAFVAAFKAKFNSEPGNWEPMGYTGLMMIAEALKNAIAKNGAAPTRDQVRDAFQDLKDVPVFIGEGKFSVTEEREPKYGQYVMMVKDGKFVAPGR